MSTQFALPAEEYTPFGNVEARNGLQAMVEIPLLIRALKLFPAARILEVGCGRGIALPVFAARLGPRELVGIDIDPDLVTLAKERARFSRIEATILEADVRRLPFDSDTFDLVFDFGTCYHVGGGTDGARQALKEIARVLAPYGLFVHETRIAQRLAHPIRSFGRKLPWHAVSELVVQRKAGLWGVRRKLAACALFAAMTFFANPLKAQVTSVTPGPDSTDVRSAKEGREAGWEAANESRVTGRGVAAFFAGLPVGFFGPIRLWGGHGVPTLSTVAGMSLIVGAGAVGRTNPPPELEADANSHGSEYARAFDEAYAQRLRVRRGVAALVGGAAGTAAGFGVLFYLLSHAHWD